MNRASTHHPSADRQGGLFTLLILTIFSTEVVLDGLWDPFFSGLSRLDCALLDAFCLTAVLILPLWFFFVRPLYQNRSADPPAPPARTLLLSSLAVLFLTELLVMLLLPLALPTLPLRLHRVLDAACTASISSPLLWWVFFRKMPTARRRSAGALLKTPLRLYVVLLLMVFLLTMLQDFLCSLLLPTLPKQWNDLMEAVVVTLLFAPALYFLVVRPLVRSALSQQAKVSALYLQMTDAVITLDATGGITSVNPAAEETFGYRASELSGEPAEVVFRGGRECLQFLLDAAAPAGVRERCEFIASHRDGELRTMDISISRVTRKDGEEFLLVMRDVTERHRMQRQLQESEERFRQIFNQSDDAIIFFDPESCRIVDANGTAEGLYGCGKDELQERGVGALVGGDDLPSLISMIRSCSAGSARLDCVPHRRKDGSEIFLSVRGKLMTLQGVPLAYCTFRDVTARIRLEEEAREMQSRLIHMNKMASLGLVVSGVAHEVNNPNNYIMANSQLLAGAWHDALKILHQYRESHGDFILGGVPFDQMALHIPELCQGVADGSRRINEIIDNLKSFARQDRGGQRKVDVNQVVQGAVSVLQYELHKHTDRFQLALGGELPPVEGNGQQLGQVTINLLMNACQALPSRAAAVWVATSFDRDKGEVTITVRDEGCGITRAERTRVMEPFFTTKLDRGGTGLGLSISHSIVKEHRGALEFESEPGKGSTFVVRLPAAAVE